MSDAVTGVTQADYMQLFMKELSYQDPLKPIDNREFMAQMAQFSALQEAKESAQSLKELTGMATANQAVMLLGKKVQVAGKGNLGTVISVSFPDKQAPKLSISIDEQTIDIDLIDIVKVEN